MRDLRCNYGSREISGNEKLGVMVYLVAIFMLPFVVALVL
jgi:hypothetical protein